MCFPPGPAPGIPRAARFVRALVAAQAMTRVPTTSHSSRALRGRLATRPRAAWHGYWLRTAAALPRARHCAPPTTPPHYAALLRYYYYRPPSKGEYSSLSSPSSLSSARVGVCGGSYWFIDTPRMLPSRSSRSSNAPLSSAAAAAASASDDDGTFARWWCWWCWCWCWCCCCCSSPSSNRRPPLLPRDYSEERRPDDDGDGLDAGGDDEGGGVVVAVDDVAAEYGAARPAKLRDAFEGLPPALRCCGTKSMSRLSSSGRSSPLAPSGGGRAARGGAGRAPPRPRRARRGGRGTRRGAPKSTMVCTRPRPHAGPASRPFSAPPPASLAGPRRRCPGRSGSHRGPP